MKQRHQGSRVRNNLRKVRCIALPKQNQDDGSFPLQKRKHVSEALFCECQTYDVSCEDSTYLHISYSCALILAWHFASIFPNIVISAAVPWL